MTIIVTNTVIQKWEQLTDDFRGSFGDGEKQVFFLTPHHPVMKSMFKIDGEIHINCRETDFILDITIATLIQFEPITSVPSIRELYELYTVARKEWNGKIQEESNKCGYDLVRHETPVPFEVLKPLLEIVRQQAYPQN